MSVTAYRSLATRYHRGEITFADLLEVFGLTPAQAFGLIYCDECRDTTCRCHCA